MSRVLRVSPIEYMRRKIDEGFDIYLIIGQLDMLSHSWGVAGERGLQALIEAANVLDVPNEFRNTRGSLASALRGMGEVIHRKKVIDEKNLYEGKPVTYNGWDCEIERISMDYRVTLRFLDGSSLQRGPGAVD